jgi:hypothetical protein
LTGCSSQKAADYQSYRWMKGTNALGPNQVEALVSLLDANLVPPSNTTAKIDTTLLTPNFYVDVKTQNGKVVAQLLGFEGKWIAFGFLGSIGSITDSNIVRKIYGIVNTEQ